MLLSSAVRFIFQMTCSDKSENKLQLLKPETVMQVYLNLGTVDPHIEACISCSQNCYGSLNRSRLMVKKRLTNLDRTSKKTVVLKAGRPLEPYSSE
jgi:hypothetical protein